MHIAILAVALALPDASQQKELRFLFNNVVIFTVQTNVPPIEQLQADIEALPHKDFVRLREWFAQKDWQRWDQQLESDVAAGKLDFLLAEAIAAKSQGKLQNL